MRRIVLSVLFLFGIVCGWHAMGERLVLIKEQMTEQSVKSEAKQYVDPMILVLTESNRLADTCVRTANSLPTNFMRRHRMGGGCWGNLPELFKNTQKLIFNHLFKSYHDLSQSCAAQQRSSGYYFYTLRKMII